MLQRSIFACVLLLACSLTACAVEPEPLGVWTAADHAHPPDNMVDPTRVPQQERPDLTVGELLWQGHCARCHGSTGKGGAEASLNFSSAAWQASMSDKAITQTIAAGKPPSMPSFSDLLSGAQIQELVQHLRAFGRTTK